MIYSNGYGKQVPVSFKLARDVCDRIITDEEWLWQMVLNLLTNACKYTDKGEIRVTVSKTNGSEEMNKEFEEEMLMVEVVDTGEFFSSYNSSCFVCIVLTIVLFTT